MRVIVDEQDAATLLRILYNGRRPRRVHTLICACGMMADLRLDSKAWNGWQILPHPMCPQCIERERRALALQWNPVGARERFMALLERERETV